MSNPARNHCLLWVGLALVAFGLPNPLQVKDSKTQKLVLTRSDAKQFVWGASEWQLAVAQEENGFGEDVDGPAREFRIYRNKLTIEVADGDGATLICKPLGSTYTTAVFKPTKDSELPVIPMVIHGEMVTDWKAYYRGDAVHQVFRPAFPKPGKYTVTARVRLKEGELRSNRVPVHVLDCPEHSIVALSALKDLARLGVVVDLGAQAYEISDWQKHAEIVAGFIDRHRSTVYGSQLRLKLASDFMELYNPRMSAALKNTGRLDAFDVSLDEISGLLEGGFPEEGRLRFMEKRIGMRLDAAKRLVKVGAAEQEEDAK